jgi:hypothetical protein
MPNPNDGLFSIKLKNGSDGELFISILDNTGKTVLSNVYKGSSRYEFDLRNFAKGEYFVKIETGLKIMIRKLVIK